MIKMVSTETVLIIKGRRYALFYDDSFDGFTSCYNCAFQGIVCKEDGRYSLVHLCDHMQGEPDTFFLEINL